MERQYNYPYHKLDSTQIIKESAVPNSIVQWGDPGINDVLKMPTKRLKIKSRNVPRGEIHHGLELVTVLPCLAMSTDSPAAFKLAGQESTAASGQ